MEVGDEGAQQDLHLLFGCPREALDRAVAVTSRLCAALALNEPDLRVIHINERTTRADDVLSLPIGSGIEVEGDIVDIIAESRAEGGVHEIGSAGVSKRKADDLGIGVDRLDRLRGVDGELRVLAGVLRHIVVGFRFLKIMLPAKLGLVPDLPELNSALKMLGDSGNVVDPTLSCIIAHRRALDRAEDLCGEIGIERVAVAKADPGLHSARAEIIDDLIEPLKIINSALALGLEPTRLNSYLLDTDRGDLVISLFGIKNVAVELFKADSYF